MKICSLKNFFLDVSKKKDPLVSVKGIKKAYIFRTGDVLKVTYIAKNNAYTFNGLCMFVRKGFNNPNLTFLLRNVIMGIGIEMIFHYFGNRLFEIFIEFYKKKNLFLRSARIFYVRKRLNRQSRVI